MSVRTTNFDAVFTSAPADATAARVVSKGGEHWQPKTHFSPGELQFTERPPTKPIPNNPEQTGLMGARFGRLTVIGQYAGPHSGKHGAVYVCRCACSNYVLRKAKAIRAAAPTSSCADCNHLRKIKDGFWTPEPWKINADGRVQGGGS